MANYADQIRLPSNCGSDYDAQNPVVLRAYNGFISYLPLYQAGCLKADAGGVSSSPTDEYCYVAASTNVTQPADSYIYLLPLGVDLPGDSVATCSSCVKQTMSFFASAAQNLSSPLSADYAAAALQINTACGVDFVPASVKPIAGSDAAGVRGSIGKAWGTALLTALVGFVVL